MSVTLYAVWRNYRNEWECVAVEAEEKPNTYIEYLSRNKGERD